MTTNRNAAIALLAGSLGGLVTMALHPTGRDVMRNASAGASNTLAVAVHVLALLAQPLLLAGTLALIPKLRARRDMAIAAYIFFATATVAVIIAAVASGIVAPGVVSGWAEADAPARAVMMNTLAYTGRLNQAFALVYVTFSAVAIVLWSVAALGGGELPRTLALCGILLGAGLVAGMLSGWLHLDVHGFGLVVLGEGAWMAWVAALLWRTADG
jgi:hypothetical protein